MSITSALALFTLIVLSSALFFISKRIKVPYTLLLVLVGLLLVPITKIPYVGDVFGFLTHMTLTPELLFYIFLPVLIFESGFNMSIRRMLDSAWTIMALAVVGLVISTFAIGGLLYYTLPLIGIEIPLIAALMFGALISPTDPVAVLALFKEYSVPRRLVMLFEGETLFNDATAIAVFLILLGVAMNGFHGTETVVRGVFDFIIMLSLGVVIGIAMAALFSRAMRYTKKNEFVTVTLMLVSAHFVFIVTELINQLHIIHVSSVVATVASSLFLGNYSRNVLAPKVDEYLHKLIEHMTFVANSLVFLMAGMLFAGSGIDFSSLWLPILITVLVVATARALSVYMVTLPLNRMRIEKKIPSPWRKLLAWGSLRGALSIIIVLLIPEDLVLPGWNMAYSIRDFMLALTICCILTTLFVKAPFISPLVKRYRLDDPEPLKEAHQADLSIYYLLTERSRLQQFKTKGFVNAEQYEKLIDKVNDDIDKAQKKRKSLVERHGANLFDQSLHLALVHVEKNALKRLFINDEVSEKTYRKIHSKLCLQQEQIEDARHKEIDPKVYSDKKDIFDRLVGFLHAPFEKKAEPTPEERLEYYRAQMIMARKAVKTIESMQSEHGAPVFLPESFERVLALYRRYKERCSEKADMLVAQYKEELTPYMKRLAVRSLHASGTRALAYLRLNGLIDEHAEEELAEIFTPATSIPRAGLQS